MTKQWRILRCMPKIMIDGGSIDHDLHVLTLKAEIIPQYEFMCAAVDEAGVYTEFLKEIMDDIERIEKGNANFFKESTEGWEFEIKPDGVQFEGLYDQGTGGQVSLAQFKLAIQTYLRFLQDPERKPIEVVFPD